MNINRKQLKPLLRDPVASLIDVENIKMYLLKGFSDVSKSIRMSSVISQKGESQNSCGGKKCSFFGKLGGLFLETPVLRFTLLPYYRRNKDVGSYVFACSVKSKTYEHEISYKN